MKLGRNMPCWCGSRLKYKRCHFGRDNKPPLATWEVGELFNKAFGNSFCCAPNGMLSQCSGKIVRAHSVPRSKGLNKIERGDHVYALIFDFYSHTKIKDKGQLYKLVGTRRASTFTGFCAYHDSKIFSIVENRDFESEPEQCLALAYRAICREFHIKYGASRLAASRFFIDSGKDKHVQREIQSHFQAKAHGTNLALKDLIERKAQYETALFADPTSHRSLIITMSDALPVMCSGGFLPEEDFFGVRLQSLSDPSLPACLTVTSFYGGNNGHIVFTWLQHDDFACIPFIRSLISSNPDSLLSACTNLMFAHFENVQISPDWWERLPEEVRLHYEALFSIATSPFLDYPQHYLGHFPSVSPLPEVIRIESVGFLL